MFAADGTIRTTSNYRPPAWVHWPRGNVFHHIIPYGQLRDTWNRMTQIGMTEHRLLYLQQVTANAPHGYPLPVPQLLAASSTGQAADLNFDFLEIAICWQAFNIAVGPRHRPALPDPGERFDHLSVMPQHVDRITQLRDIGRAMGDFLHASTGGTVPKSVDLRLGEAIESMKYLTGFGLIPQHDVNWYGLERRIWIQMSPRDRQAYDEYIILHPDKDNAAFSRDYALAVVIELSRTGRITPPPGIPAQRANQNGPGSS